MLLKATKRHLTFAVIVSAALAAACGGGATDMQTDPSNMPLAGGAPTTAGRTGGAGASGALGTAGSTAPRAGNGSVGSAGMTASAGIGGSAGNTATAGGGGSAGAGKAGAGAAGMTGTAGAGAAGMGGSSGAGGGATFTAVYNALFANGAAAGCFGCHGGMANPALNGNFAMVSDKATAWTGLVGAMSSEAGMCKGMTRVKSGDPMASLLYLKLAGTPSCGMQMPPGGSVSAETLTLVKNWITAGAKND